MRSLGILSLQGEVVQRGVLRAGGQAIPWPCLPQKEFCGFDFWTIYAESLQDVNMNRAPRVVSTEVEVQGKTFPLFTFNKDLAESIIRVIDTTPVPQADGDSGDSPSEGGLLKSGMFEHLPEWP